MPTSLWPIMALLLTPAPAKTVVIENRTERPVHLRENRMPGHFVNAPTARIAPGSAEWLGSPLGKIMVPVSEADQHRLELSYVDEQGNGCRFVAAIETHSNAWVRLRPAASAIGTARCEARTGRTVGDFVYVIAG